jgi:hypothetical protein
MDERWTDEDDGDYAYDNWKDKEMEKDIEAGYKSSKEAKAAKKGGAWNAPKKIKPRSSYTPTRREEDLDEAGETITYTGDPATTTVHEPYGGFSKMGMAKLKEFIKTHKDYPQWDEVVKKAKNVLKRKQEKAKFMKGKRKPSTTYKYTIAKQVGGDDGYQWTIMDKQTGHVFISGLTKPEVKYYRDKAEAELAKKYEADVHHELEPGEEMLDELFNSELSEIETATDKLDAERAEQDRELGEPAVDPDAELAGMQQIIKNMMQEPDQDMEDAVQQMATANVDPVDAELSDDEVAQIQQLLGLMK